MSAIKHKYHTSTSTSTSKKQHRRAEQRREKEQSRKASPQSCGAGGERGLPWGRNSRGERLACVLKKMTSELVGMGAAGWQMGFPVDELPHVRGGPSLGDCLKTWGLYLGAIGGYLLLFTSV